MKFTSEQFLFELGGGENFRVPDFPIDWENLSLIHEIFNNLPLDIQSLALSYGFSDSGFINQALKYLVKIQLNMSILEFYESEYFLQKKNIRIEFSKFPGYVAEKSLKYEIHQLHQPPWIDEDTQLSWVKATMEKIKKSVDDGKLVYIFDFAGGPLDSYLFKTGWERCFYHPIVDREYLYQTLLNMGHNTPKCLIDSYVVYMIDDSWELREDFDLKQKRLKFLETKNRKQWRE